jgi:hypothetical protein
MNRMFLLRRIVSEKLPDAPSCLRSDIIQIDPVFSETFGYEKEAEERMRQLQNDVEDWFPQYYVCPA